MRNNFRIRKSINEKDNSNKGIGRGKQPVSVGGGRPLAGRAATGHAYLEGGSPDELGLVMALIGERLEDFAWSYPAEAGLLFAQPLTWEMAVEGEIIFQLREIPDAFLDFGLYPEVAGKDEGDRTSRR